MVLFCLLTLLYFFSPPYHLLLYSPAFFLFIQNKIYRNVFIFFFCLFFLNIFIKIIEIIRKKKEVFTTTTTKKSTVNIKFDYRYNFCVT